jgi:hypothetical protein
MTAVMMIFAACIRTLLAAAIIGTAAILLLRLITVFSSCSAVYTSLTGTSAVTTGLSAVRACLTGALYLSSVLILCTVLILAVFPAALRPGIQLKPRLWLQSCLAAGSVLGSEGRSCHQHHNSNGRDYNNPFSFHFILLKSFFLYLINTS